MNKVTITLVLLILSSFSFAQSYQIGLLKYRGGGDWYANLETSIPNLIQYANIELKTKIDKEQAIVEVGSSELFNYPFIHMTGHGNVIFSTQEAENLRNYLRAGGFLHIDDNYGMDKFVRNEMKKVFPELDWIQLPASHPIYHQKFDFNKGLPKVHEHDNKAPEGLGLIYEGRLVCFYTFEADLGDGWEDQSVHNDSQETRKKALQMGTNILQYVLLGDGQTKK